MQIYLKIASLLQKFCVVLNSTHSTASRLNTCTCKISSHFATVAVASDLNPPHWCTMDYYQRVRGHYLPVRAHWELPGYNVGAGSLQNILHSELSQLSHALLSFFPPLFPFQYDTLSHRKMSAVSQEEKKKRRKVLVLLLLLKISLVKFSLSQRQAAQTRGLLGVRGRRGRARKTERKRKGRGWSRNRENEQIAQAKLA